MLLMMIMRCGVVARVAMRGMMLLLLLPIVLSLKKRKKRRMWRRTSCHLVQRPARVYIGRAFLLRDVKTATLGLQRKSWSSNIDPVSLRLDMSL